MAELTVTQRQIEAFVAGMGTLERDLARLPDLEPERQRHVYQQIIERVDVTREDIAIRWRW